MSNILISGVGGLIGSHLAKGFLQHGHRVIGVDNMSGGMWSNLPLMPDPQFHFFQTDLTNYSDMREIFMSQRPEVIYHCAANAREGASFYDPYKIVNANALIASIVIELGIKYGMKKFVFTSSMARYGDQQPPFGEKLSPQPVDIYGASKVLVETMIQMLAGVHSFQWTVLVPHNCFGEGQSLSDRYRNVIGIFMNSILRHEPIYFYGKDHVRAFSYMGDCLPAFIKAAELKPKLNQEVINIGGIEPTTIADVAEEVIKNFPEYPRPEIIELPPRYGEAKEAFCTCDKSIKLLDFKEEIKWRIGIERMASWAKSIGPSPWKKEPLAIPTEGIPFPWRGLQEKHISSSS